jgi:hypothetical protein
MEKAVTNVKANSKGTMVNRTRQCHLYADDVVALGLRVKHIAQKIGAVTPAASQIGLAIHVSKTKYN